MRFRTSRELKNMILSINFAILTFFKFLSNFLKHITVSRYEFFFFFFFFLEGNKNSAQKIVLVRLLETQVFFFRPKLGQIYSSIEEESTPIPPATPPTLPLPTPHPRIVQEAIHLTLVVYRFRVFHRAPGMFMRCIINMSRSMTKTNKMTRAQSEDSDQPGHPLSLISLRCVLNG